MSRATPIAAVAVIVSAMAASPAQAQRSPESNRVCDAYGLRFYYIPGTETCLRINGIRNREQTPAGEPMERAIRGTEPAPREAPVSGAAPEGSLEGLRLTLSKPW